MANMIILRGVPGAGKNSLASMFSNAYVCCADDYFMNDGKYVFDATKLRDAHAWCQSVAKHYLTHGIDVVIANTNTTDKEVDTYMNLAKDLGATVFVVVVENRHGNTNVHGVPETKISQMRQRLRQSIKL